MLREDNADLRLVEKGHELGLLSDDIFKEVISRKENIASEIKRVKGVVIKPSTEVNAYLESRQTEPIQNGIYLDQLLKRVELNYHTVETLAKSPEPITDKIAKQVEIEIKYEGYIERQLKEIKRFKNLENIRIPKEFDFKQVHGLSNELKEKLTGVGPISLGQASRIDGITPAALSVLMVSLKAIGRVKGEKSTSTDSF